MIRITRISHPADQTLQPEIHITDGEEAIRFTSAGRAFTHVSDDVAMRRRRIREMNDDIKELNRRIREECDAMDQSSDVLRSLGELI